MSLTKLLTFFIGCLNHIFIALLLIFLLPMAALSDYKDISWILLSRFVYGVHVLKLFLHQFSLLVLYSVLLCKYLLFILNVFLILLSHQLPHSVLVPLLALQEPHQ